MSMFGCARTTDVRVPGNQHEVPRRCASAILQDLSSSSTHATVCVFGHESQGWAKWSVRIPHGRETRHRDHECCRGHQTKKKKKKKNKVDHQVNEYQLGRTAHGANQHDRTATRGNG